MTKSENTTLNKTEARQGETKKGMPSVLAISTSIAALAMIIFLIVSVA